ALDQRDHAERADDRRAVSGQVEEQALQRVGPGLGAGHRRHGDQEVAGVSDRRVRQHALHAALRDGQQVSREHRQGREPHHERLPSVRPERHRGVAEPPTRMRTSVAKAATLTAAAMKPVTGAGAPSYTSGTHMWNGTAATLNANPEARRAAAAKSNVVVPGGAPPVPATRTALATSPSRVEPVAPKASAAP